MTGYCGKGVCGALDGHDGTCDEASGWVIACGDLGCVNGQTVQGRTYDGDGKAEEQWAPCGRRLDACAETNDERVGHGVH